MSGGAGHIYDIIGRLKNNASILKGRGYFKTKEELLKVSGKTIYEYKKASPEQLKAIRIKLINQRRVAFIKSVTLLIFSFIGAFAIIGLLIYWFI